jgi:hypothetical protein
MDPGKFHQPVADMLRGAFKHRPELTPAGGGGIPIVALTIFE